MAHKSYGNLPYTDNGGTAIWKLTRVMKAAGWVYKGSSDATTKDTTGVATSDLWGGAVDPMTDATPSLGGGSWWIGQGPSTLKIPLGTNVPSAAMIRGEKITQATTLAEGELLGIVTDPSGGNGYLVVAPRTGTFNGSNTITGAFSTATITPSGTVIEFIREVIFWRNNSVTGHAFYQCIDSVSESAKRFSVRAAASSTLTYPGQAAGGDPGNGSMSIIGTLTSTSVGTGSKNWTSNSNSYALGKSHLFCANATPGTGVSADGSFIFAMGQPGLDSNSYIGFAFQRCDDSEDGDVDPYVVLAPEAHTIFTGSRTVATAAVNQPPWSYCHYNQYGMGSAPSSYCAPFRAFRRRGLSGESFVEACGTHLAYINGANMTQLYSPANQTTGDAETVSTAIVSTKVREPIWVDCWQSANKVRKGTLRWIFYVQGGGGSNTYDNLQWVQLGANAPGLDYCYGAVAGPWDGITVPSNS